MSHCDARVPVEVKNFLSQKIFQLFLKTCLLHVSGLWDNFKRNKFFSDFQTNLSPDIAMRSQRQELPFTCNQRRGTLPVRITWKGDWSSGVSLRCQSASLGKNFFKKIFNSFSKRVLSMFQDSGIILSKKFFFRLSDQSESRYRYEIPKAETSFCM